MFRGHQKIQYVHMCVLTSAHFGPLECHLTKRRQFANISPAVIRRRLFRPRILSGNCWHTKGGSLVLRSGKLKCAKYEQMQNDQLWIKKQRSTYGKVVIETSHLEMLRSYFLLFSSSFSSEICSRPFTTQRKLSPFISFSNVFRVHETKQELIKRVGVIV